MRIPRSRTLARSCFLWLCAAAPILAEEEKPGIRVKHLPACSPDAGPEDLSESLYPRGQRLAVAVPSLNVREKAKKDAATVVKLPFGTEVTLEEIDAQCVTEDEVPSHWIKVAFEHGGKKSSGYVFGGFLSPVRLVADFDGSGRPAIATVTCAAGGKLRVRFRDEKDAGAEVQTVDIEPAREKEASDAEVKLVPATEAGVPLVRVESRYESCGAYSISHVSLTRSGKTPKAQLALNLIAVADPPVNSSYKLQFDATKKQLVVDQEDKTEDEAGKETIEKSQKTYDLKDGVYVARSGK